MSQGNIIEDYVIRMVLIFFVKLSPSACLILLMSEHKLITGMVHYTRTGLQIFIKHIHNYDMFSLVQRSGCPLVPFSAKVWVLPSNKSEQLSHYFFKDREYSNN